MLLNRKSFITLTTEESLFVEVRGCQGYQGFPRRPEVESRAGRLVFEARSRKKGQGIENRVRIHNTSCSS